MKIVSEANGVSTIQINQQGKGSQIVLIDTDSLTRLKPGILRLDKAGYLQRRRWQSIDGKRTCKEQSVTRTLMGILDRPDLCVDHISRDTLDKRMCNLRVVTRAENSQNRGVGRRKHVQPGEIPERGVRWDYHSSRWRAIATVNGSVNRLGNYRTHEEAVDAVRLWRSIHMPMSSEFAARLKGEGVCPSKTSKVGWP